MQKIIGQFEGLFSEDDLMQQATAITGCKMIDNGLSRNIKYHLSHRTIGEAHIETDVCRRCFREGRCLSMGEDEYGNGYLCKQCIDWLFKNDNHRRN